MGVGNKFVSIFLIFFQLSWKKCVYIFSLSSISFTLSTTSTTSKNFLFDSPRDDRRGGHG